MYSIKSIKCLDFLDLNEKGLNTVFFVFSDSDSESEIESFTDSKSSVSDPKSSVSDPKT